MIDDDRIIDLLMRREELRQQGADPTVDELCADCPELREQLAEAIETIERFQEFVRPIMEPDEDTPFAEKGSGTFSGPFGRNGDGTLKGPEKVPDPFSANGARFQFLRPHRTGGLGEVSIAYDGKLDREVALKHIRKTLAGDVDSCRRFLREARITGRLEHPGIVPVYDLMGDADGPPSYAMRLVQGETLKEAIERFHGQSKRGQGSFPASGPDVESEEGGPEKNPVPFSIAESPKDERAKEKERGAGDESALVFRQLLNRFVTVCQTMAYAHSRGIIHRDLKPANVILGKYGETIVVDWGLAKPVTVEGGEATAEENESRTEEASLPRILVGDSVATEQGQVVGTPQYMSPEQAVGQADQLGPASDVYSLGVTLYCLLTGSTPFPDPREIGVPALLLRIQQREFRRPRQVQRKIDRALEAICLKAMALRPEDRYASAGALADDLEHWLADEPVTAYREPWYPHIRRWGRRHRLLITGLAAALIVGLVGLTAGLVVVTGLNRRLDAANADLVQKSEDLDARNAELVQSNAKEERARKRAEDVLDYFVEAFRRADPSKDGQEVRVVEVLNRAGQELRDKVDLDAATRGGLLNAIGQTYVGLGLPTEAVDMLEQAVALRRDGPGPEEPETLASMNNLGRAYIDSGRFAEALTILEDTVRVSKAKLGSADRRTLISMSNLALTYKAAGRLDSALPLFEETLKVCKAMLGPDRPETLSSMSNLAEAYREAGRLDDALPLFELTLPLLKARLGPNQPETLIAMNNLALLYHDTGRWIAAVPLLEETLKLGRTRWGPDHPKTINAMSSLAFAYQAVGRLADALPLLEETLKLRRTKLGPEHPYTLASTTNLAAAYRDAGRCAEALPLLEDTLKVQRQRLGLEHPNTLTSMSNLALAYQAVGRAADAVPLHEETLKLRRTKLGPRHPHTLSAMNNLALAYKDAGRWAEALPLCEDTLQLMKANLGVENPFTLTAMNSLAVVYRDAGRLPEAVALLEEALRLWKAKLGPEHPNTFRAACNLAGLVKAQGKLVEAEAIWRDLTSRRGALAGNGIILALGLAGLGGLLIEKGQPLEAAPLLRECLELRRKNLPRGHVLIGEAENLLGRSLTALGRFPEAEPLLLSSYQTFQSGQGVRPVALRDAARSIVQLYEAWDKPEKATEWQSKDH